jgi:hypothetical protein
MHLMQCADRFLCSVLLGAMSMPMVPKIRLTVSSYYTRPFIYGDRYSWWQYEYDIAFIYVQSHCINIISHYSSKFKWLFEDDAHRHATMILVVCIWQHILQLHIYICTIILSSKNDAGNSPANYRNHTCQLHHHKLLLRQKPNEHMMWGSPQPATLAMPDLHNCHSNK